MYTTLKNVSPRVEASCARAPVGGNVSEPEPMNADLRTARLIETSVDEYIGSRTSMSAEGEEMSGRGTPEAGITRRNPTEQELIADTSLCGTRSVTKDGRGDCYG